MVKVKPHRPPAPEGFCKAHYKPKPCASCQSASNTQKRVWASPERHNQHMRSLSQRDNAFFDEEIRLIKELAGNSSTQDITNRVNKLRATYPLPKRNVGSIRSWAEGHGVSLMLNTVHTNHELINLLAVSAMTINGWRKRGWLIGKPWGAFWVYEDQELLAFINAKPWLFDFQHMASGPFRRAAEIANKRDPWLRVAQISRMVPLSQSSVLEYAHAGVIEFHQRTGHNGAIMIQASAVGTIRKLLAEAKATQERRYTATTASELFGVTTKMVYAWRERGFITGYDYKAWRVYNEDELIQMVLENNWLVDREKIKPGLVRDTAEQVHRSQMYNSKQWMTVTQVAQAVPTRVATVRNYIRDGKLDYRQRPGNEYRLRKESIAKIRWCLAEAIQSRSDQLAVARTIAYQRQHQAA